LWWSDNSGSVQLGSVVLPVVVRRRWQRAAVRRRHQ
jgi:hypothetical protein